VLSDRGFVDATVRGTDFALGEWSVTGLATHARDCLEDLSAVLDQVALLVRNGPQTYDKECEGSGAGRNHSQGKSH
jgi:hypothetical protein